MGKRATEILNLDKNEILRMLNEETEHEQDIEDWINDLERMKDDVRKIRI